MKNAIQKRWKDFVAVLVLMIIAAAVGGYILSHQRLTIPAWVPIVGEEFFTLHGEFQTAQAVTPGQGQTVDIAGVAVGEIQKVELKNGRAKVTMQIKPEYAEERGHRIYPNATMLLRPKTGLKDMTIQLDPGDSSSGRALKSGATVPVNQTLPDIDPDEILATLDADTRDYLRLLLAGAGEGLDRQGRTLSAVFRRFEPTSRDLLAITEKVAERQQNVRRVIHNFQLLSTELSTKDADLSAVVDSSNQVFEAMANQEANIRETLRLLPPTLTTAQTALTDANRFARALGPTLQALRPGARALGPSLVATRPFLRDTTPIIRDEIRPFTRIALPTVRLLRPAARDLAALTPDLTRSVQVLNYLLNELTYNPPGSEEGFLFWVSWANHLGATIFATQDAHGPIRHGLILISCSTAQILQSVSQGNPALDTLIQLTNLPTVQQICPQSSQPGQQPPQAAGAAADDAAADEDATGSKGDGAREQDNDDGEGGGAQSGAGSGGSQGGAGGGGVATDPPLPSLQQAPPSAEESAPAPAPDPPPEQAAQNGSPNDGVGGK